MGTSNMLSPLARCKTFDVSADGFVRGEGCVALMMHADGAAAEAPPRAYAQVLDVTTAHNGRTQHMTYPDTHAQAELIRVAHARAAVAPSELGFLEAHGTATKIGDATE